MSACDKDCIKEQLEGFYNELCPNAQVNAVDQNGNRVTGEDIGDELE